MIQERYRQNFSALDEDQRCHLLGAMIDRYPAANLSPRIEPLEIADELGLDQADVVMCLARDATALGVAVAETLVGRPIVRGRPPRQTVSRREAGQPRQAPVARNDPRIVTKVVPNPKQPGSASRARYDFWEVGITVSEALRRGLTMADVKHDTTRGFVELALPASPTAE